jgi:hypothetical protein
MTIAPLADEDSRPTPTLLTSASLQRLGVDFGAELLTGCARGSLAGSAGTRDTPQPFQRLLAPAANARSTRCFWSPRTGRIQPATGDALRSATW